MAINKISKLLFIQLIILIQICEGAIHSCRNDTIILNFTFEDACTYSLVQIKNNTSFEGEEISFHWDFGDDSAISTDVSPKHYFQAPGIYQIKLKAITPYRTDSIIREIEIFPRTLPNFSFENNCLDDSSLFTNTSIISNGIAQSSFSWKYLNEIISIETNAIHIFNHSGEHPIKLISTTDEGCSDSITKYIFILTRPTASFLSRALCEGAIFSPLNTTSLSDSSSGALQISYLWDFGDGKTSISPNPNHQYLSYGEYNIKLTAESENGCLDNYDSIVTISPLPTPQFFYDSISRGDSIYLRNNSTIITGRIEESLWIICDSQFFKTDAFFFKHPDTTTFPVELTITSDAGCKDSIKHNINIYPAIEIDFEIIGHCKRDTILFKNKSNCYSNEIQYLWDFGDISPNSKNINEKHIYKRAGIYKVKLIATTIQQKDSIQKTIFIYDNPNIELHLKNTCAGEELFIDYNIYSNSDSIIFFWDFGDNNTSFDFHPRHIYSNPGNYTIELSTNTENNCMNKISSTVEVYPRPNTDFSANDTCSNAIIYFKNSSSQTDSVDTTSTFYWEIGANTFSTEENPQYNFSSSGIFKIKLYETNKYGCKDTMTKAVTIYPVPAANFLTTNACVNDSIQITNLSSITSGNIQYIWNFDESLSYGTNPQVNFHFPGIHYIKLTTLSEYGCKDSIIKEITIYPEPIIEFSVDSVCQGTNSNFFNTTSISSGSIESYFWDFGDGSVSQQHSPMKQYKKANNYTVSLQAKSNRACQNSTNRNVIIYPRSYPEIHTKNHCIGETSYFENLTTIASGNITNLWDFGDSYKSIIRSPKHKYSKPGTYLVKLQTSTNPGNCNDSTEIQIQVFPLPKIDAGNDTNISKGYSVELQGKGGLYFNWRPSIWLSEPHSNTPFAYPETTTQFILEGEDINKCSNTDTLLITVNKDYLLSITNIITPDGNGKNDTWIINNIESYPNSQVYIFDRDGTEMFYCKQYNNDWNGTNKNGDILPDGTYYYIIQIDDNVETFSGSINLFRNKKNNS